MLSISRTLLRAAVAVGVGASVSHAAGNGAIERPAPHLATLPGKPVELRPDFNLAATLNAIIAAQIAAQNGAQVDQANPYRQPRPRPDREHLVGIANGK